MKIMIFGATGCFGTALESVCLSKHLDVVPLTHADVDVVDHEAVCALIDRECPSVIVNSVAIVGINPCEEAPDKAFSIHATAALNMMKAATECGAIFVQTSTHAVFDGTKDTPYTEDDVPNLGNVYGVSKYAAELFAATWCPRYYTVRFPTMYGPRRNNAPGFVDKALGWMKDGRELSISADKIDSPTFALDAAQTVLNLVRDDHPNGVYHVANAGQVSYFDFVCALRDLIGSNAIIRPAKDADFPGLAPKPLKTTIESIKLPPMRDWRDALEDYVTSHLQQ